MQSFLHDLRYGARLLVKHPGFTLLVVLTLALGIGANTAIFSVVEAVLLRSLPFAQPEQLVLVRDDLTGRQIENAGMSVDELRDLQERSGVFSEISAVWPVDANLTGSERPERVELLGVSPNYFTLLGARAQLGRVFGPEDVTPGFAEGVVISDGLWRRLFAADPQILGRKVRADNDIYTIIGVMPPGFRHPARTLRDDVEMWAAAGYAANPFGPPVRAARILPGAIGRIKPGLGIEQAQAQIDAFVERLREEYPNEYPAEAGWRVRLLPVHDALVGGTRTTLLVLLAAVGLVLLIGCVNIANLLLARSTARQREMAIRAALGAVRARLLRQLLCESLLLAILGGAVSLLLLTWMIELLPALVPADIPRLHEVGLSRSVIIFAFLASLIAGLIFGIVPAFQASRPDVIANLKDGSLAVSGARHHRFRSALVVAQFALSLMLMIGAGLLLRSFGRLLEVNPGFNPKNVLLARIWLPVPNNPELDPYRPPERRAAFAGELLRRLKTIPGIEYAALGSGNGVPLIGPHNNATFTIEDRPEQTSAPTLVQTAQVSPDYFRALGAPLVSGRFFSEGDDHQAPRVAIIDEAMARRFFPDLDPVGRRLKFGRQGSNAPWMTIVGVVGNIKTDGLNEPDQPHLYTATLQTSGYSLAVYLRTKVKPESLTQALREQVQAVDPNLPVFGEQTMESLVAASLAQRRFALEMVGLFAVVALLLSGMGIYGVMAYAVSQRRREIGIRIALGAQRRDILRWVIGQGMRLTLWGVGAGLAGAVALTRLIESMLFEVAPTDAVTYALISALLTVVALAACYLPARRAMRVDPMIALRYE